MTFNPKSQGVDLLQTKNDEENEGIVSKGKRRAPWDLGPSERMRVAAVDGIGELSEFESRLDSSPCSLTTREWLTSEQAADYLGLSVGALRNMTSNGQIPYHKLGRRNRYLRVELRQLLLSQKRGASYGN
jgi:excisionase family DNA binding protein